MPRQLPRTGEPEEKVGSPEDHYEDLILTQVDEESGGDSWGVMAGSTGFGIPQAPGIDPPQIGDRVRLWSYRGSLIHGIALRGTVVFYRTQDEDRALKVKEGEERRAEEREEWEKTGKAELQRRYEALPEAFRRRIDGFRSGPNPNWGPEYEAYEMGSCELAAMVGERAKEMVREDHDSVKEADDYFAQKVAEGKLEQDSVPPTAELRWIEWWNALHSADFEYSEEARQKQKELLPGYPTGHSGNSWSFGITMAIIWLRPTGPDYAYPDHHAGPEGVKRMPGALAPLVGSEEYGDPEYPEPAAV